VTFERWLALAYVVTFIAIALGFNYACNVEGARIEAARRAAVLVETGCNNSRRVEGGVIAECDGRRWVCVSTSVGWRCREINQ